VYHATALQLQRAEHDIFHNLVSDEDKTGKHDALQAKFGMGIHDRPLTREP
jgi:hypothetical protein